MLKLNFCAVGLNWQNQYPVNDFFVLCSMIFFLFNDFFPLVNAFLLIQLTDFQFIKIIVIFAKSSSLVLPVRINVLLPFCIHENVT